MRRVDVPPNLHTGTGSAPASDRSDVDAFDEERFRELYPSLRRFAAFCSSSETDPDDLVQDALCGYLRNRSTVERMEPYLRRSIYHAAIQKSREAARRPTTPLTSDDLDAVEFPESDDSRRLLRLVSPEHRAALYLIDVVGFSSSEASAVLGISAMAVRARVSRARKAIRTAIEATGAHDG